MLGKSQEAVRWANHTIVLLAIKDKHWMELYRDRLRVRGIRSSEWVEPDCNDEITAIACYTNSTIFDNLKLL